MRLVERGGRAGQLQRVMGAAADSAASGDGFSGPAAAPFDGATDTEMFVAFVETFLVPTLKPGQAVVMDNLSAHKSPRVDQAVEAAGARVLRLPPYSPDFNPIEMAISKMKSLLRKLGRRSLDYFEAAIAQATQAITPSDARGFMTHCGYRDTIAGKPL
jgi:transposase